ncbi:MAG: hypothetical protein M1820_007518 [Bogoriella megaspora]|nr:MAG: hypothetical protein M1820_007518 [Bogoriella megaspora]
MNGAFELPAESNPLTEISLFHSLNSATSSDPTQLQTGTKQLQKWENEKGFYPLLQSIFLDNRLPLEVRYLSIIQLKNGIDKYWRKAATNAVHKEDRARVRERLLSGGIQEADRRLALQNALVIAKITKFEFPNDWPDLLTGIVQSLRSSSSPNAAPNQLPRTLLILLQIVKELTSGRTPRIRATLQTLTSELFLVIAPIYVTRYQNWLSFLHKGGDDEGGALHAVEDSLLALKVIRRLVIGGVEFPNRDDHVQKFWTLTREHFAQLLPTISQTSSLLNNSVRSTIEKHLLQLSKFHLEMAQTHSFSFIHMDESLNLVRAYWNLASEYGITFASNTAVASTLEDAEAYNMQEPQKSIQERLCLKGLLIVRACFKLAFNPPPSIKYKQPQEKEERAQATEIVRRDLLTPDLVKGMMEVLVTRFFVTRAFDLREWEEDPEEWENKQDGEGDSYEFLVRPCAEKLFLDSVLNFKDLLVPPLLSVFESIAQAENRDLSLKDSVYTAIGLAAHVAHQQLDFDKFINSTFVPESQIPGPGYSILRRRIAIVFAQWVPVKISKSARPAVYDIFRRFLNKDDPTNDAVVRITAARQLEPIVSEWEFDVKQFLPYAPETLTSLMGLIETVELAETKLTLLNTVSSLVTRMEHHISPYADEIVSLLPRLWEQSGEEHLMKQSIMTIFAHLVASMKADSRKYHEMALPLIRGALEPNSESRMWLLEDALDLLANILAQTETPASQDLLSIAPHLIPILELGTDTLRQALELIESYVMLAPSECLSDAFRRPLIIALDSLLGSLKVEASGVMTHLVETLIVQANLVGGNSAMQNLITDLLESYFLPSLLNGLHGSYVAHCTTGPLAMQPPVDGALESDYFTVLARLLVASPQLTLSAIQPARTVAKTVKAAPSDSSEVAEAFEQTMAWLLEEWFSHYPDIPEPSVRKLHALALSNLLTNPQPFILSKLQDLMTVWTSLIVELRPSDDPGDAKKDALNYDPAVFHRTLAGEDGFPVPEAPEEGRKRELQAKDPIYGFNMSEFVTARLGNAIDGIGGVDRFREQWLLNVDGDVVKAFGDLGII